MIINQIQSSLMAKILLNKRESFNKFAYQKPEHALALLPNYKILTENLFKSENCVTRSVMK